MNEKKFIESLNMLGFSLTEDQIKKFKTYAEFLLEYNKNVNLTAIRNIDEVYLKHFYDSLLVLKYRKFNSEKILDIGSGAGFPGVPIKIVCPNVSLTLIDSNGKKTKFLNLLKEKLNIDCDIVNDRAENYVKNFREQFDVVVSRAVSALPILSELSLPFIKKGGEFIAYKGNIDDSLEEGRFAIQELGGRVESIEKYTLPEEDAHRTLLFIEKMCQTDLKYPRSFDKINKKPLKKN